MKPDLSMPHANEQTAAVETISVIVCAYTEERWNDLTAAVTSLKDQTVPPSEVIVVIDHNPRLFERARAYLPDVTILESLETPGLSGARNTGAAAAHGSVIAFMDEDALADPDWLARLHSAYADPEILGAGGKIEPLWLAGKPSWFPNEFGWVVGCSYKGLPERAAPVRNLIGTNMSFRAAVLRSAGGFRSELGRIQALPLGCEETELCIRAQSQHPGSHFLYDPSARVKHRVTARRGTLRYFITRCYAEGLSKAAVSRLVGARDGLSAERAYTRQALPRGIGRGLADAIRGDLTGLARAGAILLGAVVTAFGYALGTAKAAAARQTPIKMDHKNKDWEGKLEIAAATSGEVSRESPIPQTGADGRRPRILMVTPRFYPFTGGVENHVAEVASRLARWSLDVTVLTTDPTGKLPAVEQVDGYRVERVRAWPEKGELYIAPSIYQAVARGGWDLVHIQSYHTFVPPLAMLAALRQRIPYVVTFHAGGNSSVLRNSVRRTQRAALKPLLRRADRLIALANFEIEQYGSELGLGPEHFVLIPNGCDLPEIPPQVKDRHHHPLIASVGRLERYKGHQRILTALPHILKEKPDARLWIAGTGPYEPQLRRLARKLGVQDQVEIRAVPSGERQRMAAELSRASLAVMLSEYETHPLAVLEALSLGVPALVADNSGLRELADAGLASRIRTESSPQEIARAVVDQLEHPMIPAELNLPTWDDCAASLFNLYASIIGIPVGEDFANINVEPVLPSHTGRD